MKFLSSTILSAAVFFLFSCEAGNHQAKNQSEAEVHNHDDHTGHDHSGHGHSEHDHSGHDHEVSHTEGVLTLNNGKKWDMSESLMKEALYMSALVNDFDKSGSQDYAGLAGKLSDKTSDLINKCELPEGVAHENLHEWLHPYMGLIKEMGNATTKEEGKVTFVKIQESLVTFRNYFE